ncbi:MAG: GldG family protein [Ruminococcus sp.]|nr:GldG family protein [Ruminococcus sp.]
MNKENMNNTEAVSAESAKASLKRMTTKQRKLFNTIFIIIFLLIFAGVNVFATFLVKRFPSLELDFTSSGAYSLNTTTEEYVEYMDVEVNIKVLMEEESLLSIDSTYGYQVNQLLRELSKYKKVNLEYVNIEAISMKAMSEKYPDVNWSSADNLLIVEDKATGKYECLGIYDVFAATYDQEYNISFTGQYLEQCVLSSIQKITSDKIVKIALSTGNGEFFNENSDLSSYCAYLPIVLEDNAYEIERVNLLSQSPSEDTDIIIMMAPSVDLTTEAVDNLSLWLSNNGNYGRTLVYVPFDHKEAETPNIDLMLEQWGMKVKEGYISENDLSKGLAMMGDDSKMYSMMDYAEQTYTEGLADKSLSVLMPYCMPVEILDENMAKPLLQSSSMADVVIPSKEDATELNYEYSNGQPLNAAVISTKTNDNEESSQIVVWGSYDGLSDRWTYSAYSSNFNNTAYFINLLNILTDNDAMILVESVDVGGQSIIVTSAQQITVFALFVIVIPVALVVIGLIIWNKRRHR